MDQAADPVPEYEHDRKNQEKAKCNSQKRSSKCSAHISGLRPVFSLRRSALPLSPTCFPVGSDFRGRYVGTLYGSASSRPGTGRSGLRPVITLCNRSLRILHLRDLTLRYLALRYLTLRYLALRDLTLWNLTLRNMPPGNLTLRDLARRVLTPGTPVLCAYVCKELCHIFIRSVRRGLFDRPRSGTVCIAAVPEISLRLPSLQLQLLQGILQLLCIPVPLFRPESYSLCNDLRKICRRVRRCGKLYPGETQAMRAFRI